MLDLVGVQSLPCGLIHDHNSGKPCGDLNEFQTVLWQQAGRVIGSGQDEKAVDQVVGMRQKDRWMS